ncbi:DNA polymerase III subunit gamma/tau [Ruminococcaceae bacterium OttesenSCG-928-O06]|nr:DNA polymerase III subunit gamma/tau [Ruminococcaceae bacterium OttesenSCG-928-O06]
MQRSATARFFVAFLGTGGRPVYRALYRKWRPQRFADVVGQESITTALANQISAQRIGHAYLFTGTRGTGKTTCAKIFAKAVNCEARDGAEPCGECVLCQGMESGSILDVMEIDAASNNGVEDVRELREETLYRPSRGQYRVYIIDEVHMLSTAAFNALLKIMEEPPSHVIFILATTESHKVPATILSRCQRFDFMRIAPDEIAGRLRLVAGEEGIALTDAAADLIARLADGAMRDALSLLDTCAGVRADVDEALVRKMAGVADKDYLFAISGAVLAGNTAALLAQSAALRAQSIDVRRLAEELAHHYRNLLLARSTHDAALLEDVPQKEQARYMQAAQEIPEEASIQAIRRLAEAMDRMGRAPDPRIELELALFDLADSAENAATERKTAQAPQPVPGVVNAPQNEGTSAAISSAPPAPAVQTESTDAAAGTPIPTAQKAEDAPDTPVASPAPPEDTAQDQQKAPPAAAFMVEATTNGPTGQAGQMVPGALAAQQDAATAPQDEMQPFTAWPEVLQRMKQADKLLYSYMEASAAYTNGQTIFIDGGDLFLTFMRQNESARERIKAVVSEVTGRRYGLGPYERKQAPEQAPQNTVQDTLRQWEAMGVDVEYE